MKNEKEKDIKRVREREKNIKEGNLKIEMGRYGGQASMKVKERRERERSKRLCDDKNHNFSCTRTLMHLILTQFSTSY